ncbi:hypothetical protein TNCV_4966351 [Trichonephila clavipes]|nr:hypothetical protein TNCV_4966351 [Trichonephila clavipes]
MRDIKINDNCLFEVERRLNVFLNSNKSEQWENQHAEKLVKDGWNYLRSSAFKTLPCMFQLAKDRSSSDGDSKVRRMLLKLNDGRSVGKGKIMYAQRVEEKRAIANRRAGVLFEYKS